MLLFRFDSLDPVYQIMIAKHEEDIRNDKWPKIFLIGDTALTSFALTATTLKEFKKIIDLGIKYVM